MNSTNKAKCSEEDPWFKRDPETGKYVPLPKKWLCPSTSKDEKEATSNTKKPIRIAPLKLTDFEESPQRASKVRKIESVRKGLFNVPPNKNSRPSVGRRSISRRSVDKTKKIQQKKNVCELSPLLDMEEVEEELLNKKVVFKGYPFRTPSKPAIKFSTERKCSPLAKKSRLEKKDTPKKGIEVTPTSTSSNETEFLELEKMCYVDESSDENNKSPISSVCNLLKDTKLGSVKKHKIGNNDVTNVHVALSSIENILEENRKAFEQYRARHEETLAKMVELMNSHKAEYNILMTLEETNKKKIDNILDKLKDVYTEVKNGDKENLSVHNRRSERLLNKSPVKNSKSKLIVSPVITKSRDLRKTTLTKNLVAKTQQYQIESPRILKALDMYNSMRGEHSILATPKLDRNSLMESPKSSNASRMLSRRVQSQCLLLQDTPIHK